MLTTTTATDPGRWLRGRSRVGLELFRDWQEITNSIFCAGPSGLRQQMDVWFSIEEEPPPRGTNAS